MFDSGQHSFFLVSVTASAKVFQRHLAILHHKKGYWGQFQAVENVSFERGRVQAGSSVASRSIELVSFDSICYTLKNAGLF